MEHLAQYTGRNPVLELELFGLFRAQTRIQLEELERAVMENDAAAWRFTLHTLKGMANLMGAFGVAEAARKLEETDPLVADLSHLQSQLACCEREIARHAV